MRDPRVGVAGGLDESVDDLVLDLVGEIARGDRALEPAPIVLDLLVLGQCVRDAGEQPDIVLQHAADRASGSLTDVAVFRRHQIEDLGAGQVLAVEGEAQRRHRLVEQPDPGAATGHMLLMQRLLELVGQLVRPEAPYGIEPGREVPEPGRRRQLLRQEIILQAVELQGHEQQMRTDRRDALLHALVEATDFRIVASRREQQLGVREGATCSILERLVALDQAGEAGAVDLRQATLVLGLQCNGVGGGSREIRLNTGVVRPAVQVVQVPYWRRLGRRRRLARPRGSQLPSAIRHPVPFVAEAP